MSKIFRYGNTISLRDIEDAVRGTARNLLATSKGTHREDADEWPAVTAQENTSGSTNWPGMRWTIRKSSKPNESDRVRYGDIVTLAADGLLGVESFPWALTVLSNGYAAVVPWEPGTGEQWKIINPANTSSTDNVNFGDTVAFQALARDKGYLSHAATHFARTVATLGEKEKWILELVPPVVTVGSPLDEGSLQSSKSNAASIFRIPLDLTKEIVLGVVSAMTTVAGSQVPGVGFLGKVAPFLFPEGGGVDIWPMIRENVEALVKEKIDESKYSDFKLALEIVEKQLKVYKRNPTAEEARTQLTNLVTTCDAVMTAAKALPRPEQALPYIAMAGTLHIMTLHERWRRAGELWKEPPDVVNTRAGEIADAIDEHQKLVNDRKIAALKWRRGLVSAKAFFGAGRLHVNDDFFGIGPSGQSVSIGPQLTRNDPFLPKYTDFVTTMFEEQLSSFLLPCRMWKYMKADSNEIPVRKTESFSTGPYGFVDRETFIRDPESKPIRTIEITAGQWVDGMLIEYSPGSWKWYGTMKDEASSQKLIMSADERIVSVWGGWRGNHEFGLHFDTNKKRSIGGGTGEHPWRSQPPASAQAYLAAISGHYDPERVSGLYLHWKYTAWE